MKRFEYLSLYVSRSGISVWSTDLEILEWITNEVEKHVPTSAIRNQKNIPTTDVLMKIGFHKLNNKDLDIGTFLFMSLPKQGWRILFKGTGHFETEGPIDLIHKIQGVGPYFSAFHIFFEKEISL